MASVQLRIDTDSTFVDWFTAYCDLSRDSEFIRDVSRGIDEGLRPVDVVSMGIQGGVIRFVAVPSEWFKALATAHGVTL